MRHDFDNKTKEALAKRVAMRCSNPNCRQPTSAPATDDSKSINVGVAAHIAAASPGGKRYDSKQTKEERSNIKNGIWLCQTCAKLIDSDETRYTTDLLLKWKQHSEQAALLEVEAPDKKGNSVTNVISINQSGGQTAKTIVNQRAFRRNIDSSVKQHAVQVLTQYPTENFTIRLSSGDAEMDRIAEQIKDLLLAAGWKEIGFEYNLAGSYPDGIEIAVPKSASDAQNALLQLLHGAKLIVKGNKYDNVKETIIIIGPNPDKYIN